MRENAQGPDRVTETEYVSATQGPNRDTESYYKATPAPGELRDDRTAPPPSSPSHPTLTSDNTGERLSLRTRSNADQSDVGAGPLSQLSGLPWLWIGGGIAAIMCMSVVGGGLLLYLMWGGGEEPQSASEQQQQQDEDEWEGLKVKKGLR